MSTRTIGNARMWLLVAAMASTATTSGCTDPCVNGMAQRRQQRISSFVGKVNREERRRPDQLAQAGRQTSQSVRQRRASCQYAVEGLKEEADERFKKWKQKQQSVRQAVAAELRREPPAACEMAAMFY